MTHNDCFGKLHNSSFTECMNDIFRFDSDVLILDLQFFFLFSFW